MPLNGQAQTQPTTLGNPRGGVYVVQPATVPVGFQYQLHGGAYWVGGDLSGSIGGFAGRYFLAT